MKTVSNDLEFPKQQKSQENQIKIVSYHVSSQVNAQDRHCAQRQRDVAEDERQKRRNFGNVRRQSVRDGFFQIVEDQTALLDSRDDRGEIVVQEDHVGRLF